MGTITTALITSMLLCFFLLPAVTEKEIPSAEILDLNDDEISLDKLLKKLKSAALSDIEKDKNATFYGYKKQIEKSKLFRLIKKMPKGASLDGHLFGLISFDFLYNITFSRDLYLQYIENTIEFSYRNVNFSDHNWHHLNTLRKNKNITESYIKAQLSFNLEDFCNTTTYSNKLKRMFDVVKSLLSKKSALKAALLRMLKEHYEDNITYMEFRYSLDFYDTKKGRSYKPANILKYCHQVIEDFKLANPKFFDARIIYSPVTTADFDNNLKTLLDINQHYPNVLVGFDVTPMQNVTHILSAIRSIPEDIQVFLYFDDISFNPDMNMNLLSAAVNRPSRYTYDNNLLKSDMWYKHIKGLGVGINVCPSCILRSGILDLQGNQNIRYISEQYRIITSSGYPSFWQARGISYDWYLMHVLMSKDAGNLGFLKQMAQNSMIYSGLPVTETMKVLSEWNELWIEFARTAYRNSTKKQEVAIRHQALTNITQQHLMQQIINLRINN